MLLAHPSSLPKKGKLNQLEPRQIKQLLEQDYVVIDNFFKDKEAGLIKAIVERLELMEMEGRFELHKAMLPLD